MVFFFQIKGYLTEKTMQWFRLHPSLSSIKIWKKSNFRPLPRNVWSLGTGALKCSSVRFSTRGAVLSVSRTKTLQFNQLILEIPLPLIPGSLLCPVSALRTYLQRVHAAPNLPLFGLYVNGQYQPILAHHYNSFIKRAVSSLGLDPRHYSSHSFRHGGASFAFNNHAPTKFIKSQGNWLSDAYLIYLTMSPDEKFKILDSITTKLRHLQ